MKHIVAAFVCYIISIASAHTQNCEYTLQGNVFDFHDGTPLSAATIYMKALDRYTTTDIDGKFTVTNLCKGALTLTISHIGCESKTVSINVNGNVKQEINLEHHIEDLNEVVINGTVKLNRTSQESVLKTKDIETFSGSSLGQALKQISGVSTINTGNNIVKPIINGLHSSRVVIITNNVRLQDQDWGIEHAPNVDINTANTIHVIKGANALAYGGDAIGGAVVLKPKTLKLADTLLGKTIIGGQSNGKAYHINTALTKTWKKGWYIKAQASTKQNGDFKAADYQLTNTASKSFGANLDVGFHNFEKGFNVNYSIVNNEIGILRAAHIGNVENLVSAINSRQPLFIRDFSYNINAPKQDIKHQILKAHFYKRFKQFGKLDLQYNFQDNQRFEFDIRVGDDRDLPVVDLKLKTHTFKSNLKIDANRNAVFKFGTLVSWQNNFPNPETRVRRLIPDYDKYDAGVYGISNLKLNASTNLDLALRYDFTKIDAKKFYLKSRWAERNYDADFSDIIIDDIGSQFLVNPVFNYHNVSLSAGISYQINTSSSWLFNYGLSNRAPNPAELFSDGLHVSAARIELGDLRIEQEHSNRVAATYQFNNEKLALQIEGFANHINNFINIEPSGTEQTIRGAFPVWSYIKTDAFLYGIDVNASYQLNNTWNINNKSSFIQGRDLEKKDALIDIPAIKTVNTISYTNKKWLNFNAALQSEWVFKQNNYPNNNFTTLIPRTQQTVLVDVSSTPPAYHLMHFNSSIDLKLSHKNTLNVGLNIANMFNTAYRENLNRLRFFADDLGRNIQLQIKLNY